MRIARATERPASTELCSSAKTGDWKRRGDVNAQKSASLYRIRGAFIGVGRSPVCVRSDECVSYPYEFAQARHPRGLSSSHALHLDIFCRGGRRRADSAAVGCDRTIYADVLWNAAERSVSLDGGRRSRPRSVHQGAERLHAGAPLDESWKAARGACRPRCIRSIRASHDDLSRRSNRIEGVLSAELAGEQRSGVASPR